MLRAGLVQGQRCKGLGAGSAIEPHGMPRRASNWTLIDSEEQTQFMTELELAVHPGHRRRLSEVGKANTTDSTAMNPVCDNLAPNVGQLELHSFETAEIFESWKTA